MNVDHELTNVSSQYTFVSSMADRVRSKAGQLGIAPSTLADAAGIKRAAMTNYWRGDRAYPVEVVSRLAERLSTTVDWLLTGVSSGRIEGEDTVGVQEIDLAYGLGGTYSDGPVEVETHRFPRAWLEKITTTPAAALIIARGRGDSMQPTIQDGDMVMIDRDQRAIREQDAIWAMTIGDIAMIKRVRVRGERVIIQSDNDRVTADEAHHEEVNIVGRVIFIGRRV